MSLLILGSVAFDTIETPYGKTDKIIGGAASYIALCASYFTKNIGLLAVVGDDFPQEYIDLFKKKGVSVEGLQVKKGEKTFFWSGKYHENMNYRDSLLTELNVLEHFDPIVPESYQNYEYLMLGNLMPNIQIQTISRLKKRPKLIVLDTMNLWINIALEDLKKLIPMVDVLTINDEEARLLSGEDSLKKAAFKIRQMGVNTLIIKKGEHGALLFQGEEQFYCPALPLEEVFDPTGAGDTFAGGFIAYLSKTNDISFENMKRGLIYGSAMASFCVEKFGTERLQNLSDNEIQERVKEFVALTRFEL